MGYGLVRQAGPGGAWERVAVERRQGRRVLVSRSERGRSVTARRHGQVSLVVMAGPARESRHGFGLTWWWLVGTAETDAGRPRRPGRRRHTMVSQQGRDVQQRIVVTIWTDAARRLGRSGLVGASLRGQSREQVRCVGEGIGWAGTVLSVRTRRAVSAGNRMATG